MIQILYSPSTAEIDISGTSTGLVDFADTVRTGGGRVPGDLAAGHPAYERTLGSVIITEGVGMVVITVNEVEAQLEITGALEHLAVLAEVIGDVGETCVEGTHQHVEYFPDHFFLAPESLGFVISCDPSGNEGKS